MDPFEKKRLKLDRRLRDIFGDHVYFEPPTNIQMVYPCVIYNLEGIQTIHGDNKKYITFYEFSATTIEEEPDSKFLDHMLNIEYCSFIRPYVAENLYHKTFTIYVK